MPINITRFVLPFVVAEARNTTEQDAARAGLVGAAVSLPLGVVFAATAPAASAPPPSTVAGVGVPVVTGPSGTTTPVPSPTATPTPPVLHDPTQSSPSQVNLSWSQPGGALSYTIRRKTAGGSFANIAENWQLNGYSDGGLVPEHYEYQIEAKFASGATTESGVVGIRMKKNP